MPIFGAFTPTHSTANVATTGASTVLAANANRKYAHLFNFSTAAVIWLSLSTATAVVGAGIPLNPASATGQIGGSYEMSAQKGNLYVGAIGAIASATTAAALIITESV